MSRVATRLLFLASVGALCLAVYYGENRWGYISAILMVATGVALGARVLAS